MSRTKGHSFERLIASEFKKELGFKNARRHLEYQDGEANGIDIQNVEPFLVQCKRKKEYSSISAIHEIILTDNDEDKIPLLITKADSKPAIAVLPWSDLKELIKKAYPTK